LQLSERAVKALREQSSGRPGTDYW
jgi:hypothetical protein